MVIRQMYIEPAQETTPIPIPRPTLVLLVLLLLGMLFVGVYPAPLMDAIQHASDVITPSEGICTIGAALGPSRQPSRLRRVDGPGS